MFNDIEAKCLGQRALQGAKRPSSFVLTNLRNWTVIILRLVIIVIIILLLILIGDGEVKGVEKFRDKYYLDETEANRNGTPFNAILHIVRES